MKKYFSLFLVALLFALTTTPIKAEDSAKSTRPFVQKVQNIKQEAKERAATREGQRKEKMNDLRIAIVTNFFNNMIKRFEAAQERLTKILDRIESRVAKIKTENPSVNLTNVDSQISSVKVALTENQTKIDALKANFEKVITSENPREQFKTILSDISGVKKNLETIRRALSKIITEIKGLHVGESKTENSR